MSNTSLVRNLFVSLILVSSNGSSANKWEGVQEMDGMDPTESAQAGRMTGPSANKQSMSSRTTPCSQGVTALLQTQLNLKWPGYTGQLFPPWKKTEERYQVDPLHLECTNADATIPLLSALLKMLNAKTSPEHTEDRALL